jgi:Flp pilus assembly secretin CpaC
VAASDLNVDGRIDIVVANSTAGTASVFLANATGGFANGTTFQTGPNPVAVAIEDLNLDGAKDILVANTSQATVSLLIGLATGAFQAPISFHTSAQPNALAIADVNGDGIRDVITANSASDNFSILLGIAGGGFSDPSGAPVPSTGGQSYSPTPSFNYEDLGLVVKATPRVHGDEAISLEIDAEFKVLTGRSNFGLPVISRRKLTTQVRLGTGEWAMVGGLLSTNEARTVAGLPVSVLAKHERDRTVKQVLILLKARLLNGPPERAVSAPVPIGTETRPRLPL